MRTASYLLAACLLSAAYPLDAHAQPTAPVTAQVGQLFDQAQAAYAKGDKQGAYDAYKAAWALQKSYDIAGNLGNVEMKLGKYRDAAEHFAFSLDNFPPTGEPAQQQALEKKLADVLPEVGRMHVRVLLPSGATANGASVTVSGRSAGGAPIAATLFVDPGSMIVIEAKLAGYLDVGQELAIAKGSEQEVTLTLALTAPAGPNKGIVIGGASVAGVALGVGAVLAIVAQSNATNAKNQTATLMRTGNMGPCAAPANATVCTSIDSEWAARDRLADASVGVFVGAGVVGLATLGYALLAPKRRPTAGFLVLPVVGPTQAGVAMTGAW